jgi:phytoene dehydrogenase-like protein
MDVKRTFLGCTDPADLPDDFLAAVRRFRIRGSSAKINLALDGLPEFPSAPPGAAFLAGDLHVSESLLELERAYDDWKRGRWSAKPYLDMLMPSLIDPTMAPPGRHMMTLFIQYAPYALERGGVASAENWDDAARDALRDTVFDRIEAVSPGFRERVLHAEVRTPLDIEREVGLTEGNIFQGELTFDQLLFNRPVPGWAQYRSPIGGLYLVGSSAHPGGGVMAAPGANAAREILRDLKRAGLKRAGRPERAFRAA